MDNKVLVRRWIEAVNEGDLDIVDALFDPSVVAHERDGDVHGTDVFPRKVVIAFRNAFPDLRLTVEDLVAEGDRVAVRWTASGTHDGAFMGIAPTGTQVTFSGTYIYRIAGGRIAEVWPSRDELGLLQQLGAIPRPE